MKMRIAKFIADSGAFSRRTAEKLIQDGLVSVNDQIIDTPITFVSSSDCVRIKGRIIRPRTTCSLYIFNKPKNTMTTRNDPLGRKTIYDILPKRYQSLKYVGRLDYQTTGLLLLTNDGELARRLTLPSSNILRTYIATVLDADFSNLDIARRGATIGGIKYRPMKIEKLSSRDGFTKLRICITEGKKNEIRNVLSFCGYPVCELHRISYGPINLGDIGFGKIRPVAQKVVDVLLKSF